MEAQFVDFSIIFASFIEIFDSVSGGIDELPRFFEQPIASGLVDVSPRLVSCGPPFGNYAILRWSARCEHGWDGGEQVSWLSGLPHQDHLGSRGFHPVLLPQEGKTQIKLLTQVFFL